MLFMQYYKDDISVSDENEINLDNYVLLMVKLKLFGIKTIIRHCEIW